MGTFYTRCNERLRGHRVRLSAAVRFTAGTAGSAALNLNASTLSGNGSASWSQPIIGGRGPQRPRLWRGGRAPCRNSS